MKTLELDVPTFAFIVSTRAALGAGIGLLLSDKLGPSSRRRAIGSALVGIGAATTIPAIWAIVRGNRRKRSGQPVYRDERLVGATRFPRKGDDEI
jgi:hypothetical protein